MARVLPKERRVEVYDSMRRTYAREHAPCAGALAHFMCDVASEHRGAGGDGDPLPTRDAWTCVSVERGVPQQANGADCGVFALEFARHLARRSDGAAPSLDFAQRDVATLRKHVALVLLWAGALPE